MGINFFGNEFEVKISKLIGEPVSKNLKAPINLDLICNVDTVPAGEKVFEVQGIDPDLDTVLDTDSEGNVTAVKKTQVGTAVVTFKELESPLYYRKLGDLINNEDVEALSRANDSIARGIDKREILVVLNGIINASSTNPTQDATHKQILKVVASSGDDLYDVLDGALRKVEDYGTNFVWLCGTDAFKSIGRYKKTKAGTYHYEINLVQDMKDLGATDPIKVSGKVKTTTNGNPTPLLNSKYVIFVATGEEKPIDFVRRAIPPALAKMTGGTVDRQYRLALVKGLLTGDTKTTVGVFAWESFASVIKNPLGIVVVDLSAIV